MRRPPRRDPVAGARGRVWRRHAVPGKISRRTRQPGAPSPAKFHRSRASSGISSSSDSRGRTPPPSSAAGSAPLAPPTLAGGSPTSSNRASRSPDGPELHEEKALRLQVDVKDLSTTTWSKSGTNYQYNDNLQNTLMLGQSTAIGKQNTNAFMLQSYIWLAIMTCEKLRTIALLVMAAAFAYDHRRNHGTVTHLEKIDFLRSNLLAVHSVWLNGPEVLFCSCSW